MLNFPAVIKSDIFSLILTSRAFPIKMQAAKVSILCNGGDANNLSNYMSIYILSVCSKVTETFNRLRVTSSLGKHKVISHSRFGFGKK